jgi:RimJ/RimL family protein N-acetyltransferase
MDLPFPPIETQRLRLRLVQPADATAMSRLMTPEISAWVSNWPLPFTPERASARIAEMLMAAMADRSLPLAIERRADGGFLGYVSVRRHETDKHLAGMGYWLGREFHGQGYMREAAVAARDFGFRHFDVDTIEAGCLPDNAASLAVLRALGMVQTGERVVFAPARQRDERVLYFAVRRDTTGPILEA